MKKLIAIVLAVAMVGAIGVTALAADSQPASKATARVADVYLVGAAPPSILESGTGVASMPWTTILEQDIKTPNGKDLFVDVSLMCGLYTRTLVKSSGLTSDTSKAAAVITVRVLIDDDETKPAAPGEVVFSRRLQQMTAQFAGMMDFVDGVLTITDPETLELVLDTMDAHSFNFVSVDLPAGIHNIKVQAKIESGTSFQTGDAEAWGTIGKGSVTVETVRMIKGEDYLTTDPIELE